MKLLQFKKLFISNSIYIGKNIVSYCVKLERTLMTLYFFLKNYWSPEKFVIIFVIYVSNLVCMNFFITFLHFLMLLIFTGMSRFFNLFRIFRLFLVKLLIVQFNAPSKQIPDCATEWRLSCYYF